MDSCALKQTAIRLAESCSKVHSSIVHARAHKRIHAIQLTYVQGMPKHILPCYTSTQLGHANFDHKWSLTFAEHRHKSIKPLRFLQFRHASIAINLNTRTCSRTSNA
jgi:hypothetical protein